MCIYNNAYTQNMCINKNSYIKFVYKQMLIHKNVYIHKAYT